MPVMIPRTMLSGPQAHTAIRHVDFMTIKKAVWVFCFFLRTVAVFVWWRGLSVCRVCLPLSVLSVRRDKAAGCTKAKHCQEASKSLQRVTSITKLALMSKHFLLCPRPLRLHGSLDATCQLSTAFFPLLSPKLFIPTTLALNRCLPGWNSSGLKAKSWQQATTHQLGSAVTEREKQKMRSKVTGVWERAV